MKRAGPVAALAAILVITVVAWLYILQLAAAPAAASGMDMASMSGMDTTNMAGMDMAGMASDASPWGLPEWAGLFTMWTVMMVAMMLPTATPSILLFQRVTQQRRGDAATLPVALFTSGYLLAWAGFSAVAATAQWQIHNLTFIALVGDRTRGLLSGLLLLAAGWYQWTPLKAACLSRCRSPLSLFMGRWPEGGGATLVLGIRHGADCVACCALLMTLLFVGGVMNLMWVAGLAVLVLLEKLMPRGALIGRLAGVGLMVWGLAAVLGSWRS